MRAYVPDTWVIVKITRKDEAPDYKILAGWYGGYLGSNSWQLSSGITSVEADPDYPEQTHYHQSSGSTYICSKHNYGFSSMTSSMLASWVKESCEGAFTIETMPHDFRVPNE